MVGANSAMTASDAVEVSVYWGVGRGRRMESYRRS